MFITIYKHQMYRVIVELNVTSEKPLSRKCMAARRGVHVKGRPCQFGRHAVLRIIRPAAAVGM